MTITASTAPLTTAPAYGPTTGHVAGLDAASLPPLPGRTLEARELRTWVRSFARRRELWQPYAEPTVERSTDAPTDAPAGRHYVSLYRDADIDVWLLCWDRRDDTGWHDHDVSSGAVAVVRGSVLESRPRIGGRPVAKTYPAGRTLAFGPDHIHRMAGAEDGSVSIHAYSPPLWRMGQYEISRSGVMRRWSVSYADELRPL